jgi:hypothetical protein
MLGAPIHCWVHLAGVSGGEKTYSGSRIIIKIYPALSLATGGRDGMDGGGGHWMTRSNYRTRHQSWLCRRFLAVGLIGRGFQVGKNVFIVYYNYKNLSRPFYSCWGAGWDGWQQAPLDDVF